MIDGLIEMKKVGVYIKDDSKLNNKIINSKIYSIDFRNNELMLFLDHEVIKLPALRILINIVSRDELNLKSKSKMYSPNSITEKGIINLVSYKESQLSERNYIDLCKHEIIHAILYHINKNLDYWVNEGCAVLFSNQLNSLISNYQINRLKFKKIEEMENDFSPDFNNYILSAIYVKFLFDKHRDLFKKILKGEIGVYNFEREAINYWKIIDKK